MIATPAPCFAAISASARTALPDIALAEGQPASALYDTLAAYGLTYGPSFARADHVARDGTTIDVRLAPGTSGDGMTLDQVQANNPTRGYNTRYGADTGDWTTAMFVEAVYRTMEATR